LEELARLLRTYYGLTLLEAVHIDYGMWEESFRVDTDQGRVFAKRFLRKERQTDYMLRGIQVSQELRAQGVPAPRVLPPALARVGGSATRREPPVSSPTGRSTARSGARNRTAP
jgi:Ser/Thr protein kinase RdoA (MazF antagonist)